MSSSVARLARFDTMVNGPGAVRVSARLKRDTLIDL